MAEFRIMLLGEPILDGPQGPILLSSIKPQALLWYLAAQPERQFSRSHLAELLWEHHPETDGRQSLSSALVRLRQALPVWPLAVRGDSIGWDPGTPVAVDTVRFARLALASAATGHPYPPAQAGFAKPDLGAAASLWRGNFLEGFSVPDSSLFENWLAQERQGWINRIMRLLSDLVHEEDLTGHADAVITYARQALSIDPFQERFHQALMSAMYRSGDRAAALTHYLECERILWEELGVKPAPATAKLRDAMLSGGSLDGSGSHAAVPDRISPRHEHWPVLEPDLPLIGREGELLHLQQRLGAIGSGGTGLLLITAEEGAGKTRLVQELVNRAHRKDGAMHYRTVWVGRNHEESRSFPLEWGQQFFGDLLPSQSAVTAQDEQRIFRGVCEMVASLPSPALIVVEDIQWADAVSLRLFTYLCRHLFPGGCAILLTARPDILGDENVRLLLAPERSGRAWHYDLKPLKEEALNHLVAAWEGHPNPDLASALYKETQGNPLFAIEFLRHLRNMQLETTTPNLGHNLRLPPIIQRLVAGSMTHLSNDAIALVRAAAIFSQPPTFHMLLHLTSLSEESGLEALEQAIAMGVLREERSDLRVGFKHPLIRRGVAESLTQARRYLLLSSAYRHQNGDAHPAPERKEWERNVGS